MPGHFLVYPVIQTVDSLNACQPGDHTGWAIHLCEENGTENYCGTVGPDREVDVVLAELCQAYPDVAEFSVRWLDDAGEFKQTNSGILDDVMCELMEVIVDETPDDADNTDEHPLEEARTFLDALSMRLAPTPSP
jgi:hypothetical protein